MSGKKTIPGRQSPDRGASESQGPQRITKGGKGESTKAAAGRNGARRCRRSWSTWVKAGISDWGLGIGDRPHALRAGGGVGPRGVEFSSFLHDGVL